MDNKFKNIFLQTQCIDTDTLKKYANNILSHDEKHFVEKHLLYCEMCSDQLEGIELLKKTNSEKVAKQINPQILKRVEELKAKKKNKIIPLIIRLSAAILILFTISLAVYYNFIQNSGLNTKLSENTQQEKIKKPVKETIVTGQEEQEKIANTDDLKENNTRKQQDEDVSGNVDALLAKTETTEQTTYAETKKTETYETNEPYANRVATSAVGESGLLAEGEEEIQPVSSSFDAVEEKNETILPRNKQKIKKEKKKNKTQKGSAKQAARAKSNYFDFDIAETDKVAGGVAINREQGTTQDMQENFIEAKQYYDDENYAKAVKIFEKILRNTPQHYESLFYTAVSYMKLNKPEKAIENLDKVLMIKQGKLYNEAMWYKAQALVQNDNPGQAKTILKKIIKENNEYSNKAETLLKDLQ